jgi:hypothetical protein
MEKDLCAVCRVMLQEDNRNEMLPMHFHKTCKEHGNYATIFLIDIVAENLGFKDIEKDRECEICNKILDNNELQNILRVNSFHFHCNKHLKTSSKLFILRKI